MEINWRRMSTEAKEKRMKEGKKHVKFCIKIFTFLFIVKVRMNKLNIDNRKNEKGRQNFHAMTLAFKVNH